MELDMWHYGEVEFTSDMIEDYVGFVYVITDLTNKKKYVGKKLFQSTRRLAPLKGKKRKRKVVKESDWKDYFGSIDEVKLLVEENGLLVHCLLSMPLFLSPACRSAGS